MAAVGELLERKDRPAYVRFVRRPVEDKAASLAAGHYIAKDVDWALITPPYSKDVVELKVEAWLKNLVLDVQNDRLPKAWADSYRDAYDKWKRGEEMPLNGTAIRGWGMIGPAQQETLVRMNILTVEDLAAVNDEGIRRIGMGAIDLKNKATAWIQQNKDRGPLVQEVAAVKAENAALRVSVQGLTDQVERLMQQLKSTSTTITVSNAPTAEAIAGSISASDLDL